MKTNTDYWEGMPFYILNLPEVQIEEINSPEGVTYEATFYLNMGSLTVELEKEAALKLRDDILDKSLKPFPF